MPVLLNKTHEAADEIIKRVGNHVSIATPLGLGKPNFLLNEIYDRACNNPEINLKISTALSLTPPDPKEDIAKRFFKPFANRHWGLNYPKLKYSVAAEQDKLPKNISVHEFYFRAGSSLKSKSLQRNYQSINYTHVAESILDSGVNTIVQLIARNSEGHLSLSCNPDLTIDVKEIYKEHQKPLLMVGVVHPDLPFVSGEAEVKESFFDIILEDKNLHHELFALPRMPVSSADHAIGFYASQLIADEGTLQIGIGSLSDAVVSSLILRQQNNEVYRKLFQVQPPSKIQLHTKPFSVGIYGLSEMVTDGYMHLHRAGILKRHVTDEKSGIKTYLHGAFFLGSKEFYQWIRDLKGDDFKGLRMTQVSKVNDLYDANELLLRKQRKNPRFLNTCMQVTLLGGAVSETLDNGKVVSGIGGQYNFVAMSAELENSRSILMLRSVREDKGKRHSNIVWSANHLSIPRHLRDVVITEYGIADLRFKTDEECIKSLIEIADREFQQGLIDVAQKNGKLSSTYRLPEDARNNTPEKLEKFMAIGRKENIFRVFPLGSDWSKTEENLIQALELLQKANFRKTELISLFWTGIRTSNDLFKEELNRMGYLGTGNLKDRFYQSLLKGALAKVKPT